MLEIVNKVLLTGNKFMSKLHLELPAFAYSTYEPFTKHRERIQNLKKQLI